MFFWCQLILTYSVLSKDADKEDYCVLSILMHHLTATTAQFM